MAKLGAEKTLGCGWKFTEEKAYLLDDRKAWEELVTCTMACKACSPHMNLPDEWEVIPAESDSSSSSGEDSSDSEDDSSEEDDDQEGILAEKLLKAQADSQKAMAEMQNTLEDQSERKVVEMA